MTNEKKINKFAGKVASALVASGYYDFDINKKDDHVEFYLGRVGGSPYMTCNVYEDGCIHYYYGGRLQFEGIANNNRSIIRDILHK